jgi:uncharacterized protein (DUF305 family)
VRRRIALAVVVGLVLGYAAGWLVPRLRTPDDDSVEAGFTRDMITHHAQAVELALIAFQRAADPDVRRLAVDIATTQQAEIGMMHAWLATWRLDPTGSGPAMAWMHGDAGRMPGLASADDLRDLRAATGTDLDARFLRLMIRHHLGGVHMLDAVLAASDRAEVVRAARTMRAAQRTELANLNDLLTRAGAR